MKSLLVMISLLTFFSAGGNVWAQIRPVPPPSRSPVTPLPGPIIPSPASLPIGPPKSPLAPISPIQPTQPISPIQPALSRPPTRTPPPKEQPQVRPAQPVPPTKILVPEVRGYPRERAERFLQGARLTLGKIDTRHSDQPKGTVIGQNPEPGSQVEPRSTVNLTVAIPVPLVIPWGWVMAGLAMASLGG